MNNIDLTDRMLAVWAEHRAEGRAKGLDQAYAWQSPPEYMCTLADAWTRRDEAWRLIIGARLASEAIAEHERNHQ